MKRENGITLISLIITIIIMLILAGVSLSMVMGDGSVVDQANAAVDNTKTAEIQEYVDLAVANNKMAKHSKEGAKTKAEIAEELYDLGKITETQKNDLLGTVTSIEINGTIIDFSVIDTSYNVAMEGNTPAETIKFYINDTEYIAEVGMTWRQWVASSYNIDNYKIDDSNMYVAKDADGDGYDDGPDGPGVWIVLDGNLEFTVEALIISNNQYNYGD